MVVVLSMVATVAGGFTSTRNRRGQWLVMRRLVTVHADTSSKFGSLLDKDSESDPGRDTENGVTDRRCKRVHDVHFRMSLHLLFITACHR